MKKITLFLCLLMTPVGFQSADAAVPPVNAPEPVDYLTEDPEDLDVLSFFGEKYGESTSLSTPNWGQTCTWDYAETGDGHEVIVLNNLTWQPIQFQSPREIKKYSYVHIDVFCNEETSFRVGFHSNHPVNAEEYFPTIQVGDMTPGQWYSIEYPLSEFLARPTWSNANANLLRFGNEDGVTYSNEIYIANMFAFNGTPTCLANESGIFQVDGGNSFRVYPLDDEFIIQTNNAVWEISIYNIAGQKAGSFLKVKDKINVSGLASGIYIVSVRFDNGTVATQKVVKF
jgi:hypothetical protein